MTRIRLDIAYDGTDFHGWATQPGLRTVQQTVEAALARVLRDEHGQSVTVRLVVAGRTDAGVHALGQVAHFDVDHVTVGDLEGMLRRVRGALARDPDVIVRDASVVSDDFDARYSAVSRRYRYRVCDRPERFDPLQRRTTLWVKRPLNLAPMAELADALLGFHDWAALCKPREGATTLRTLTEFDWQRLDDGSLVASVAADAFCHNMVRYLVGAALAVGTARVSPADVIAIRDSRQHDPAIVVVPPHGLTLIEVGYPEPQQFAAQARRAMARREPVAE